VRSATKRARGSMKESGSSADTQRLCGLQRSDSRKSLRRVLKRRCKFTRDMAHPLGCGLFPEKLTVWEMRSWPSTILSTRRGSISATPIRAVELLPSGRTLPAWICTPDLATSSPNADDFSIERFQIAQLAWHHLFPPHWLVAA